MSQVNRSAFRVLPREPYLEWANANLASGGATSPVSMDDFEDASVYLLPVFESHVEAEEILKEVHDIIFALELAAWTEDESVWPPARDLAMFLDWFVVEPGSLVVDLTDDPLELESD